MEKITTEIQDPNSVKPGPQHAQSAHSKDIMPHTAASAPTVEPMVTEARIRSFAKKIIDEEIQERAKGIMRHTKQKIVKVTKTRQDFYMISCALPIAR